MGPKICLVTNILPNIFIKFSRIKIFIQVWNNMSMSKLREFSFLGELSLKQLKHACFITEELFKMNTVIFLLPTVL